MRTQSLFVGAAVIISALATAGSAGAKEIAWKSSLKGALSEARKSDQIVMVDFYTDWCGWCKKLDEDTYTDGKVISLAEKLISVKLDAENGEGKPAAAKYKVRGFPTILFLDSQGEVVGKAGGYMPPGPFAKKLEQIQKDHKELAGLLEKSKGKTVDSQTAARLASIYANRENLKEASRWLTEAEKTGAQGAQLASVYNSLGDAYQENRQFDKAMLLFRRTVEGGAAAPEKVYARQSIAACYAMQGKLQEALDEAKLAVKVQGASEESKKQTERMIAQIQEMQKRMDLAKKKAKAKAAGQQAN